MRSRKKRKEEINDENQLIINENEFFKENGTGGQSSSPNIDESKPGFDTADILDGFDREDPHGVTGEISEQSTSGVSESTDKKLAETMIAGFSESLSEAPLESLTESDSHIGDTIGFLQENNDPERDRLEDSIKTIKKTTKSVLAPFMALCRMIYVSFYLFGIQNYRYGKRFFRRFFRLAVKPFLFASVLLRVIVLAADRLFFNSIHAVHEEAVILRKEARGSAKYIRDALKKDPLSVFSIAKHYIKKAFSGHKEMFKTAFNMALPVLALIIFGLTANYWNSVTYSLKVNYNGSDIGYIQDESVFIGARELVINRIVASDLSETDAAATDSVVLKNPEYKLALVKLNQLSDDKTICDNLIKESKSELISACGVYINGKRICVVKNETDATGILEGILAPYKSDSKAVVAFVDDVKLKQGLFLAGNKMWTAEELEDYLTGTSEYTAKAGDNFWNISQEFGLTETQLNQLNPGMGAYVHEGDTFIVSGSVNHLKVKTIITETKEEVIKYETKKMKNSSLFIGDSRVIRKGENGIDKVTELVTYIDGERVSAKEIDRTRIDDPITKKVEIGTKSTVIYSRDGSYNISVSKEGFVWPVPNCRSVSSYYGYRNSGFHDGIDICSTATAGKTIVSAKDGVVESVQSGGSLGIYVVINHGDGVKTEYGHCMSGSVTVSAGDHVSAGQKIARVGSTGNATGPHLHFNLIINGNNINPLNYVG